MNKQREIVVTVTYNELGIIVDAKAEPRKTGRWLETDAAPHRIYCSDCYATYIRNKEWLAWKDHIVPRNYCPACGAKMEGENEAD